MAGDAWTSLLEALDPDPRRAAERLRALLEKLVRIFEWRGCHEPSEAALEVIERVAQKIDRGAELTTSVERYASGFLTPVFHEFLRRRQKEQKMLEELPRLASAGPVAAEEEQLDCLDTCMEEHLSREEQELLLEFHTYDGGERIQARRALAEARGKTVNALRIEAHRLRKRLRRCLEACLGDGE